MKTSTGVPIKDAKKDDAPAKKPPADKIGSDKSPYAAESSKRPYSSAAR